MRIFLNLFIPLLLMPNFNSNYSCTEFYDIHPVRNEICLQVLLKKNEYYKGKIDGQIGPKSTFAIKQFQKTAGISADGILGKETCTKFLNIKDYKITTNTVAVEISINDELKDVQSILKELGLYSGEIDGIRGSRTTNAINILVIVKNFRWQK